MKISFVIPAYNEEYRIARCIGAVLRAARTSTWDTEIIVVNNASTDRTREIASSFEGVKVVDEPRKGIVWARRSGYLVSTGSIIANIDADTVMPGGWLKKVTDEFENDPKLLALSGPYIYYDTPWHIRLAIRIFYIIGFIENRIHTMLSGSGSMLQGGNFVLRREAIEKIGGFDTSIEFYGEDTDIGRRVGKIGKVKWTFALPMNSSGRRFQKEGLVMTGVRYSLNYIWITFLGKPYGGTYADIRTSQDLSSGKFRAEKNPLTITQKIKSILIVAGETVGAIALGIAIGIVGFGIYHLKSPITSAAVAQEKRILERDVADNYLVLQYLIDNDDTGTVQLAEHRSP
jgi:glycosyltransferase involved in cell wall biosynthesis